MWKKIKELASGGFFHIFIGSMLIKMIAFISSIVVVRLVEKKEFAYVSYADNLYSYVIAFSGLGMASAILKYCATSKTKEEDKAYFLFATGYGTLFQLVMSLLVVGYVSYFTIPFINAKNIVYILFLYPTLLYIMTVTLAYLRAKGKNKLYSNIAIIQTTCLFLCSVLFVYKLGILGVPLARYISILIAIGFCYTFIRTQFYNVKSKKLSNNEIKGFMGMSISLMVASIFSIIMPINELMLVNELIRDEVATANYKVAVLIPSQLPFITQSIVIYYFTIIAKMDDKKEVWKLTKKIATMTAGIILIVSILGAIFTPIIISLVYGNRYQDAIALSAFFWVVFAINAGIRLIPMNFLPAIGVVKFNAILSILSCIVHIFIAYFSIKSFGVWGAGVATAITYLITGMLYWIYFRKKCLEK